MAEMLDSSKNPAICALSRFIDDYLRDRFPDFFGSQPVHPSLSLKRSKIIHDNLWGTNRFSWRELALIDSPLLQRLRYIHQTGLAYQIYPSAQHTRFEHSLGVTTVASKIFDALLQNEGGKIRTIVKSILPARRGAGWTQDEVSTHLAKLRTELRLAALLHDTGHSLFSHTSEKVFERLDLVKNATDELADFVGKAKGAGESIAFAVAISSSVRDLLARAETKLLGMARSDDYMGSIDFLNVALMIIGRSNHPLLQFLGDIVSSGFDADKLDYLFRDAKAAGLPLRYDIERYFFAVQLEKVELADDRNHLQRLYEEVRKEPMIPSERNDATKFPVYKAKRFFEAHRLRLPARAINTIEQIVICKLMLFSYIYHHPKVRAAEGALVELLEYVMQCWKDAGESDTWILSKFLDMTDSTLNVPSHLLEKLDSKAANHVNDSMYRLRNRLLPREVYRIGGIVTEPADRKLLTDYLVSLQDEKKGPQLRRELELRIGQHHAASDRVQAADPGDAVRLTGVRVDIPRAPKFDEVTDLVIKGGEGSEGIQLPQLFPIEHWTDAYSHYRNYVRIYCYSEFVVTVENAARLAMQHVIGIESDGFYREIRRRRD